MKLRFRIAATVAAVAFAMTGAGVGAAAAEVPLTHGVLAALPVIPLPITIPGGTAGTTAVDTCTNPELGWACAVGVGYGAYEGTCYLLGQVFKGGSCNVGTAWNNVEHWVGNLFGSSGDNENIAVGTVTMTDINNVVTTDPTQAAHVKVQSPLGSAGDVIKLRCAAPGLADITGYAIMHTSTVSDGTTALSASCYGSTGVNFPVTAGCTSAIPGCIPGTSLMQVVQSPAPADVYKPVEYWAMTPGPVAAAPYVLPTTLTTQGHWKYDASPNAPWTLTYTTTCKLGTATATQTQTNVFTPAPNSAPPDIIPADCNTILAGSHIDKVRIVGGRTGGTTLIDITTNTFTTPAKTSYPLCTDNAPVTGCWLDLKNNGVSCFTSGTYCAAWMTHESTMTCNWGPYTMAISVCEAAYATTFDFEVQSDPNPTTTAGAGVNPLPTSGVNIDPKTGTTSTTTTAPAADPFDNSANCLGGIWSWNPVDWVYVPVKCAFLWAFVPDTATITAAKTTMSNALTSTGISDWFTSVGGIVGGLGGTAGGCAGPSVTFPLTGTVMHPFSACAEPMATVASICYAFTSVTVVVLGGIAGLRALGAGFGFNFGFANHVTSSDT